MLTAPCRSYSRQLKYYYYLVVPGLPDPGRDCCVLGIFVLGMLDASRSGRDTHD